MTSGNQVDEPICIKNDEALRRLAGIADYFLAHDREILVRCDDSIAAFAAGSGRMLRRSRGFAPRPVFLEEECPEVLAMGAQLKAAACILKGNTAFLSPHIGDLETPQAQDFLVESCELLKEITQCDPGIIACDLHPDYFSSRYAAGLGKKLARVQHHHAHIAACLAEFGIQGKVIGAAMDGTGLGTDGTAWGGELLIADRISFSRAGHFKAFALPGADRAIREPWRIAASLLREAYGSAWKEIAAALEIVPAGIPLAGFEQALDKKINSPLTSSLGRIFDGVAALLAGRKSVSFEGQAAMELEGFAGSRSDLELAFGMEDSESLLIDPAPVVKDIVEFIRQGKKRNDIAAAFHNAVIAAITEAVKLLRDKTGLNRVALSGGCFQNRLLLEGCTSAMDSAGFEVFSPGALPCNDGSISLGQAVIAGEWAKKNLKFEI
jgi:hydrogenase maturation protein HypF